MRSIDRWRPDTPGPLQRDKYQLPLMELWGMNGPYLLTYQQNVLRVRPSSNVRTYLFQDRYYTLEMFLVLYLLCDIVNF